MYHKNLAIFLVTILTWAVIRSVNFISFQLLFGSIWFQLLIVEMYDDCVSLLRKLSLVLYDLKIVSLRACVHITRFLVSETHSFRTLFRTLGYPGRQWASSSCWLHAIQLSSLVFAFMLSQSPFFLLCFSSFVSSALICFHGWSRKISHCHSLLSLPTLSELPWNLTFTNNFWLIWECRAVSLAVFLCTKKINWDSQFQPSLLPIWA